MYIPFNSDYSEDARVMLLAQRASGKMDVYRKLKRIIKKTKRAIWVCNIRLALLQAARKVVRWGMKTTETKGVESNGYKH